MRPINGARPGRLSSNALCRHAAACTAGPLRAEQLAGRGSNDSNSFGFSLGHVPGGINPSGLRWDASAMRGTYRYPLGEAPEGQVRGRYDDVGVGIGYAIVRPSSVMVVSISPSLNDKDLSLCFDPASARAAA